MMKRNDWLLIGALIVLAALPTLVQSNVAWLGVGQDSDETPLKEVALENVEIVQIAADRSAESDVIDAPNPFNSVVIEWTPSDNPFFVLEIRTGQNGEWADWEHLHESADMSEEGDELITGSMIFVNGGQSTHEQVQLRSGLPGVIEDVRLTFIDSTVGPTTNEMIASMDEMRASNLAGSAFLGVEETAANPKPNIISRDVWCNSELCRPNEGDSGNACVNNDPLKYINVTHLVVHHTVTSNDASDWAPVVRAIWEYHALGRCWGDIGYNYLIDPFGNIYEGHRGGDNISGSHAGYINADSMGVSLLGTFTEAGPPYYGIKPPTAMTNSLVDLLAWKADQKGIDPWDSSWAKSLGEGRPNLMGHRDAHGTTTCPGQQAFDMLPEIRQRVAERLDFVPDRAYVDELSSNFSRNNANWYTGDPDHDCGFNGHAWFTYSTSDRSASANVGEWTLEVPTNGFYVVEAMVPFCNTGNRETGSANYQIQHAGGNSNSIVDQNEHVGLWAKIGSYEFIAGESYTLQLSDLTNDDGWGVWFDAVRLTPATGDDLPQPEFSLQSPVDGEWSNKREIDFQWNIDNFYGPEQIALRLSTTADMVNEIYSETLTPGASSKTISLNQDYAEIYWQVQALGSNSGLSEVKRFGVDTIPPSTNVLAVTQHENGSYYVTLTGSDNGAGISHYSVHFRLEGGGDSWVRLQDNIDGNVVEFSPSNADLSNGAVYEFRVSGVDKLGNVEPFQNAATGSTANVIRVRPQMYLPLVYDD
ncbi:MAG: N-acetylmuramoyl-L-alanine amidase [Anaerolineae bacterium]